LHEVRMVARFAIRGRRGRRGFIAGCHRSPKGGTNSGKYP
jgi:hypothetical protein